MDLKPILLTAALGCLPLAAGAAGVGAQGAATAGASSTLSESVGGATTTSTPSGIQASPMQGQSAGSSTTPGMPGQNIHDASTTGTGTSSGGFPASPGVIPGGMPNAERFPTSPAAPGAMPSPGVVPTPPMETTPGNPPNRVTHRVTNAGDSPPAQPSFGEPAAAPSPTDNSPGAGNFPAQGIPPIQGPAPVQGPTPQ